VLALAVMPARARGATWASTDTLPGQSVGGQFGWTTCGVGDLDGDGHRDLAIGAHFTRIGVLNGAGAVYLYKGAGSPAASPWMHLNGTTANEHFGEAIAGGHDVDGDGHPDLAIGAPLRAAGALSAAGAVDMFRGGSALGSGRWFTLTGEAANDWFGESVALGDVDGDGYADLIVGAPYDDRGATDAGAVFIYRGGPTAPTTPWRILVGETANDQFGWAVAFLGDVDGDGIGDIAVGARLHGGKGKVYLFHGGVAMSTTSAGAWDGEATDDWFGNSVAGPGDVDGGGRADLLVGAPYNDRGGSAAGAAYLFRGEDPPGSPPVVIEVGETANAQFGWSVSGAGDVNGDGHPDFVVGARLQAAGASSAAGRVYVFAGGAPLSVIPIATAEGEISNDWFGNSVADATGFFWAGMGAPLAGAPYDTIGGATIGRARALGLGPVAGVAPGSRPVSGLRLTPNPARGAVRFDWSASDADAAPERIEILDPAGRRVRRLAPTGAPGARSARWDLEDERGRRVPAGVYLARRVGADGSHGPTTSLVVMP
jgi:hypothetical protein